VYNSFKKFTSKGCDSMKKIGIVAGIIIAIYGLVMSILFIALDDGDRGSL